MLQLATVKITQPQTVQHNDNAQVCCQKQARDLWSAFPAAEAELYPLGICKMKQCFLAARTSPTAVYVSRLLQLLLFLFITLQAGIECGESHQQVRSWPWSPG